MQVLLRDSRWQVQVLERPEMMWAVGDHPRWVILPPRTATSLSLLLSSSLTAERCPLRLFPGRRRPHRKHHSAELHVSPCAVWVSLSATMEVSSRFWIQLTLTLASNLWTFPLLSLNTESVILSCCLFPLLAFFTRNVLLSFWIWEGQSGLLILRSAFF